MSHYAPLLAVVPMIPMVFGMWAFYKIGYYRGHSDGFVKGINCGQEIRQSVDNTAKRIYESTRSSR